MDVDARNPIRRFVLHIATIQTQHIGTGWLVGLFVFDFLLLFPWLMAGRYAGRWQPDNT